MDKIAVLIPCYNEEQTIVLASGIFNHSRVGQKSPISVR